MSRPVPNGPFVRRDFLKWVGAGAALVGIGGPRSLAQDAPAPVARRMASEFGAATDGRTDAMPALTRALASGAVIDGGGQTYAINGNLRAGPGFKGLVNARLIQLDPAGDHRRTLMIADASGFVLENISVKRGGDGSEHPVRSMVNETGGIFVMRCSDFTARGLRASGGGIGSAIAFLYCTSFTAEDISASSLWYRLPEHPKDDAMQGVWLARCSKFVLRRPSASDIGGADRLWSVWTNNRGIAVAGCDDFEIQDLDVRRVGQGIDMSGSGGNTNFRITRGTADDCYTWGFKFANGPSRGTVTDAVARRSGTGGFVVSGPGEDTIAPPRDITFSRCIAENVRGNMAKSWAGFGYGVLTIKDPGYPRNILFEDCIARATEMNCCMRTGFFNQTRAELTGGEPNRVIRCSVEGPVDTPYVGF